MGTCPRSLKKIDNNIWLFLGGAILILWQMLKPGYILTLDMVFTPKIKIFFDPHNFQNGLPLEYSMKIMNFFMPGWIIQKILLVALFFCLGYLAFKFLPLPKKYYLNYWGALFYVINPFVYERFIAGHWMHLFAYAFLPPFSYYAIKLFESPTRKNCFWLFFWLFLIGIFSLNLLVMAVILFAFYFIYWIFRNFSSKNTELIKKVCFKLLIGGFIFVIASSYWIVPYLLKRDQSAINVFNRENWEAFKTSADQRLGTALNVAAFYGFWGEQLPWAKYFLWPKDNLYLFLPLFGAILFLVGWGIINRFKNRNFININTSPQPPPQLRRGGLTAGPESFVFFLIAGLAGFIFSAGISDTIFKGLNSWLFEHIWFWSGFRDTQKWSGLLVLAYAYFGAWGAYGILEKINRPKIVNYIIPIIFLVPILYTYTIWGGFSRQLKPVWYPESWHKANQILNEDKNGFKVLFLPWHQYLSLEFNHKLIIANPAKIFFDKEVIIGDNMELGNIYTQSKRPFSRFIENEILAERESVYNLGARLAPRGIKYLILAKEVDWQEYQFLDRQTDLGLIYEAKELKVYKIQ